MTNPTIKELERGEARLTKRQIGLLNLASRKCGMSYRAACNRNIEAALSLKAQGFLYVQDTKRQLGQYVFRITEQGKTALAIARRDRRASPSSQRQAE